MKTIGFPVGHKNGERRRCLIPSDIQHITHYDQLYLETGFGHVLGYSDADYENAGVHIASREEVLSKDVICDPKIGDAEYLGDLCNQTIWGWVHAVQNRDVTEKLIANGLTAFAWEDMFYKGRHSFCKNNEMAGAAAVYHACMTYGAFPQGMKVAILGRGNTGRGALKVLSMMGAFVTVYDRHTEHLFRDEMGNYDAIVNCILWDTSRDDHIIYRDDLKHLKPGTLLIDVSCDRAGAIETSIPTAVDSPTYVVDNIIHYVVDNIPSLFYRTISPTLSSVVSHYVDELVCSNLSDTLLKSLIIEKGHIIDPRIIAFQKR